MATKKTKTITEVIDKLPNKRKAKIKQRAVELISVVKGTSVVKGSHLTVTTFPDGQTELLWDDDALLEDVRAAILSAETRNKKEKTNG